MLYLLVVKTKERYTQLIITAITLGVAVFCWRYFQMKIEAMEHLTSDRTPQIVTIGPILRLLLVLSCVVSSFYSISLMRGKLNVKVFAVFLLVLNLLLLYLILTSGYGVVY